MLIGVPDPNVLALEMYKHGLGSCAEAEAAGWFLTPHEPTRFAIDKLLAYADKEMAGD